MILELFAVNMVGPAFVDVAPIFANVPSDRWQESVKIIATQSLQQISLKTSKRLSVKQSDLNAMPAC